MNFGGKVGKGESIITLTTLLCLQSRWRTLRLNRDGQEGHELAGCATKKAFLVVYLFAARPCRLEGRRSERFLLFRKVGQTATEEGGEAEAT